MRRNRRPGGAAAAASSAGRTALALCRCYRGGGQCTLWASAARRLRSSAAGGNPRHCPRRDGSIIRVCVQPASMCWANTGRDIGGRERAGRERSRQSAGYDGQLMRKRTKFLSADARRNLDGIREHQMRTSGHEHSAGGKPAGVQRRSTLVSVQRRSL